MAELVTLQQVKTHLGLLGTVEHDANVWLKAEEANALVVDWLKNYLGTDDERTARYAVIDAWTVDTAPLQVRSAILRLTGYLWGFRGDDDQTRALKLQPGDLPDFVTMFLRRLRDPGMA